MANGLIIQESGGVFYVGGSMDEHATFERLVSMPQPLRLDLAGVDHINSVGIRTFLMFMKRLSAPPVFETLSTTFAESANSLPALVGAPTRPSIVRRVIVPFDCLDCNKTESVAFAVQDLTAVAGPDGRLTRPCPSCSGESETPDTFFTFLSFIKAS